MQTEADPRVRKRMACTLSHESRQHNGLILNLSQRGLFVQTSLPAEPGTLLELDVRDPVCGQPIPLQAAVVWRRRVSPRMTGVNQSGMGLRIIERPPAWQSMLAGLLDERPGPSGGRKGVQTPLAAESAGPVRDSMRESSSTPEPAKPKGPVYFVRLAKDGGPRSRHLVVESNDEASACSEALRRVGVGWSVIEIARR